MEKDVAETTCTIEVNMTVKEECLQEFVTITQLHCNSVADFMPVVAAEYGSDEDKSVNLSNDRESLRFVRVMFYTIEYNAYTLIII